MRPFLMPCSPTGNQRGGRFLPNSGRPYSRNRKDGLLCDKNAEKCARKLIRFAQTGSLATQPAQIEQLGAADLGGADLLYLLDHFAVERKDALHALAKTHLADGETALRAILARNYDTLKGLNAFFVAFFDLDLDANRVAGNERRQVGALKLGSQTLHDWMDGHEYFPALS